MAQVSENGSVMAFINSIYNSLTKSEKKAADMVRIQPEIIIYSSITDFAEMAGVGDTTVLRFCRKIGFKSYQDFKMSLAQDLSLNNKIFSPIDDEIKDSDGLEDIIQKTLNININALNETIALTNLKSLKKAVNAICAAERIHFYGAGVSAITCQDAKIKFLRIGLNVDACYDSHMQIMDASLLNRRDVAVGFSLSGSSIDTVNVMKIARESGAATICVTHHARSPITQHSDIILLTGGRENPLQGGAVSSRIAQLYVIDILYNAVFLRLKNTSTVNKTKTTKAISDKLY